MYLNINKQLNIPIEKIDEQIFKLGRGLSDIRISPFDDWCYLSRWTDEKKEQRRQDREKKIEQIVFDLRRQGKVVPNFLVSISNEYKYPGKVIKSKLTDQTKELYELQKEDFDYRKQEYEYLNNLRHQQIVAGLRDKAFKLKQSYGKEKNKYAKNYFTVIDELIWIANTDEDVMVYQEDTGVSALKILWDLHEETIKKIVNNICEKIGSQKLAVMGEDFNTLFSYTPTIFQYLVCGDSYWSVKRAIEGENKSKDSLLYSGYKKRNSDKTKSLNIFELGDKVKTSHDLLAVLAEVDQKVNKNLSIILKRMVEDITSSENLADWIRQHPQYKDSKFDKKCTPAFTPYVLDYINHRLQDYLKLKDDNTKRVNIDDEENMAGYFVETYNTKNRDEQDRLRTMEVLENLKSTLHKSPKQLKVINLMLKELKAGAEIHGLDTIIAKRLGITPQAIQSLKKKIAKKANEIKRELKNH